MQHPADAPASGSADPASNRGDVVLAVLVMAAGALVIWGLRAQPKATFDPVGSAAIPFWTAVLAIGLAAVLLVQALLAGRRGRPAAAAAATEDPGYPVRPALSWVAIAGSAAYAVLLPVLGFSLATTLFMGALGWALSDRRPRTLAIVAVMAILGGFGLGAAFRALSVSLP